MNPAPIPWEFQRPPRARDGQHRVAFVSTRIAGTDGVSLEIGKWADVLERAGVSCFYIAGECDRPADQTVLIPHAHFQHPEIREINAEIFGTTIRSNAITNKLFQIATDIHNELDQIIGDLDLDALIVENALTIPMNVPLGVAIVSTLQETSIGCLAHHHDFYWERDRFLVNAVPDLLRYAFPPALGFIQHVVINSVQAEEFSRRTGQSCWIIPNVMNFASPPPPPDDYARTLRAEIGIDDDELLVLQPTRVVARKGIEHAIELIYRMQRKAKLVISHHGGDEGDAYESRIRDYAKMFDVTVLFIADRIADERGIDGEGRKLFTLGDVYSQADLVSYPSEYEGFGNAFLEAIYHKRPIFCNRYTIFRMDIEPCGFDVVCFEGFLTDDVVKEMLAVLDDPERCQRMVEHNYQVANEYFSYEVLERELRTIVERPQNIYRVLRQREA